MCASSEPVLQSDEDAADCGTCAKHYKGIVRNTLKTFHQFETLKIVTISQAGLVSATTYGCRCATHPRSLIFTGQLNQLGTDGSCPTTLLQLLGRAVARAHGPVYSTDSRKPGREWD